MLSSKHPQEDTHMFPRAKVDARVNFRGPRGPKCESLRFAEHEAHIQGGSVSVLSLAKVVRVK